MDFYSYLWLREKDGSFPVGTPYYAGKGQGKRAFRSQGHTIRRPKDFSNILIMPRSNEEEAFKSEIELIANYGRLDLGTGCLRNRTNGGDGISGYRHSEEQRKKWCEERKGQQIAHGSIRRGEKRNGFGPEARHNMSVGQKGKKYSNRQPFSDETKLKMSISAKLRVARLGHCCGKNLT